MHRGGSEPGRGQSSAPEVSYTIQFLLQWITLFFKLFWGGQLEATFWFCKLKKGFQADLVPQSEKKRELFVASQNQMLCYITHTHTRTHTLSFFVLFCFSGSKSLKKILCFPHQKIKFPNLLQPPIFQVIC